MKLWHLILCIAALAIGNGFNALSIQSLSDGNKRFERRLDYLDEQSKKPSLFQFGPITVGDYILHQSDKYVGKVISIVEDQAWVSFSGGSVRTIRLNELARAIPKGER